MKHPIKKAMCGVNILIYAAGREKYSNYLEIFWEIKNNKIPAATDAL